MTMTHCIGYQDIDDGEEFYFGPAVPYDHPVWDMYPDDQATRTLLASPTGDVEGGVRFLEGASMSVFHNGANFDYRAIEKFYPWVKLPKRAYDSFVMAKMIWPAEILLGPDLIRARQGRFDMKLLKSHSLKAWGIRLGDRKDEYTGDPIKYPVVMGMDDKGQPYDINAKERFDQRWAEWNPFMARYMMQDNRPMVKLWKLIEKRIGWVEPEKADLVWPEFVLEYEHEYARIVAEQEDFGVRFDVAKAQQMEVTLLNLRAKINEKLEDTFGSWWHASEEVTPKAARNVQRKDLPNVSRRRVSPRTGKELAPEVGPPVERYSPDSPYTPIERITYSATNRNHLSLRLQDVYGWKPKKFGKGKDGEQGKPTVDEATLEEIPDAVLPTTIRKLILDGFVVNKLLGMVAQGTFSWLRMVEEDGRIHGRVDSNGTITRRCSHSSPNIGQTPAVLMQKLINELGETYEVPLHGLAGKFGYECRELFTADEGWELTGIDKSSLELINLGHYLFPHDEGAFSARVCDPKRDAHGEHAKLASDASGTLVTRKDAKTTIYLKVYGGSAYKLSLAPELIVTEDEVPELLQYRGLPMLLKSLVRRFDQDFVDKLDDMQKARIVKARKIIVALEAGIAGLEELTKLVTQAGEKGWIKGMDGSRLTVRKAYSTLNTLLQGGGAMACKVWKVFFHRLMKEAGYIHGVHYKQVIDCHDEIQVTHIPGLGGIVAELAEKAAKMAGTVLHLRGEYRTDAKHGVNWAQCH